VEAHRRRRRPHGRRARAPGEARRKPQAVVSHFNKATKGRLLRTWLVEGADPRDADELATACEKAGVVAELGPRPKTGQVRRLDVVVTDL